MDPTRPIRNRNFYPGDCRRQVEEFLKDYRSPAGLEGAAAAVVPHAGWAYSGAIAARAWKSLLDAARPETVVIFGAAHSGSVTENSLDPEGSWETPLGPVAIDRELAAAILRENPDLLLASARAHRAEHSIEVEMPMLKALAPELRVVPILVPPHADPVRLGERIGSLTLGARVAAGGSTDFTHYGEEHYGFAPAGSGEGAHAWMKENDRRLLALVLKLQAEEIVPEALRSRSACGPGALAAAVSFARARGRERAVLLEHRTSHEVRGEGEFTFAVGYAGVVI